MALVGYARVSAKDQDLAIQLKMLEEAGCTKIFQEKASGIKAGSERPEFEACMNYVRDGDVLIVTRLDRWARSTMDFHRSMARLDEKGVKFRCLLQPINTTTPEGKLLRDLLAAIAEFETAIRKERQAEGIAAAKAKGTYSKEVHGHSPQKFSRASFLLNRGRSYVQVSELTGIPLRTLYNQFPPSRPGPTAIRNPKDPSSTTFYKREKREPAPENQAAPEAQKPEAPKKGVFSGLFGGRKAAPTTS